MVFTKTEDECMKYDREVYIYVYISRRRRWKRGRTGRWWTLLSIGFRFDDKKRGRQSLCIWGLGWRVDSIAVVVVELALVLTLICL